MELLNFGPKKLGFGCMRLPMSEGTVGGEGVVDTRQVCAMVDAFLEQGFCYFDTAHGYIAQKSEPTVRQCLVERHPRDRYLLTDKLSGTFFQTEEEIRPFFESQLEITGAGTLGQELTNPGFSTAGHPDEHPVFHLGPHLGHNGVLDALRDCLTGELLRGLGRLGHQHGEAVGAGNAPRLRLQQESGPGGVVNEVKHCLQPG